MTIRTRLLLLLLPTLTAFLIMIALFFYFNWSGEILDSFKHRLKSIVVATAEMVNPQEVEWITTHLNDPDLASNPTYLNYRKKLLILKQKLPIYNLFLVQIEPVKEGEYVLNDHNNPLNMIHEASDQSSAYRQVMLIDVSQANPKLSSAPGAFDFSETQEHLIYFTKKAFVTPIYSARLTNERFMSAYAPILDAKGNVIALLGADESTKTIDQKLSNALLMIILGTIVTLFLLIITVFLIANLISKPVQQLNKAALGIAAGDYQTNIHVEGPREIVELANTLNTMSECLIENIDRLKESSLVRERMYGEYECALLLQHYMLQQVVDDFSNTHVSLNLISTTFSNIQKGLLLRIEKEANPAELHFTLIEAKDPGFASLFALNQKAALPIEQLKEEHFLDCRLYNDYKTLSCRAQHFSLPLVWSFQEHRFVDPLNQNYSLHNKDMIFFYNSGLVELFETEAKVAAWFTKVLKHFAQDGFDTIQTMLKNELDFIAKKEDLKRNCLIISLQIIIPEN